MVRLEKRINQLGGCRKGSNQAELISLSRRCFIFSSNSLISRADTYATRSSRSDI